MTGDINLSQTVLRLSLTLIAAAAIGFERETNSRPAGLRTTLLVSLAACISMLQVEALLPLRGKAPDSYIVLDLMRLPLGILSGMGFIGAGAILRRNNLVVGVTTAATLWFATVMGLCFGGGQIWLGVIAGSLGIIILRSLRWVELHWQHEQRAVLRLVAGPGGPAEAQVAGLLKDNGYWIGFWSVAYSKEPKQREMSCDVHWRGYPSNSQSPPFLSHLALLPEVFELEWNRETNPKQS